MVHSGYVFGYQTELRRASAVALIMKRDRLKAQDGFTGFVYRFNLLLKAPRGTGRAELTSIGHDDWQRCGAYRAYAIDVADPSRVAKVLTAGADSDDVTGCGDIDAGGGAQSRIVAASVIKERKRTHSGVVKAGSVVIERVITDTRVPVAAGVIKERVTPVCSVINAVYIAKKRGSTGRRVLVAAGVAKERLKAGGRVVVRVVGKERKRTYGCVVEARGVAVESI